MKNIILFIFALSTFIYSQNNYQPDKLVSKSSKSQECFVVELNENYLKTKSHNNSETKFLINTIDEVDIDGLGIVYTTSAGFRISIDSLNTFLSVRTAEHFPDLEKTGKAGNETPPLFNNGKKFYFAIYYFPFLTKELVMGYDFNGRYIAYEIEKDAARMESQFGYNPAHNLFVILSVGYSSSFYSVISYSEYYDTYNDNTIKQKSEYQNSISKYLFQLGVKYYFGNFRVNNVNPFISFDIGKQFAFADNYNKISEPPQVNRTINNENEYIEGLNSPLLASLGVGAEYAISSSLSLSGIFELNYSSFSTKYKSKRYNDNNQVINYISNKTESNKVIFRTGLGLIFFF